MQQDFARKWHEVQKQGMFDVFKFLSLLFERLGSRPAASPAILNVNKAREYKYLRTENLRKIEVCDSLKRETDYRMGTYSALEKISSESSYLSQSDLQAEL